MSSLSRPPTAPQTKLSFGLNSGWALGLCACTRHDWPVEKAFVDSPVKFKGNSKLTSGNSGLNNVCDDG